MCKSFSGSDTTGGVTVTWGPIAGWVLTFIAFVLAIPSSILHFFIIIGLGGTVQGSLQS